VEQGKLQSDITLHSPLLEDIPFKYEEKKMKVAAEKDVNAGRLLAVYTQR
jgi:hypothetical protein